MNELYPNFQKLKEYIDFTPLYALWYCTYCKYNHYNLVNENCLSGGRYCYPDPGEVSYIFLLCFLIKAIFSYRNYIFLIIFSFDSK